MSNDFIPEQITIPAPRRSTMPRGIYSERVQSPNRSIRIPDDELEDIDQAAQICDMTRSEFMRWVTHYAAIDIKNQHSHHGYK